MVSLHLQDLSHEYDDRLVFESVGFDFDGARVSIVGPNGSGKTTLVRIISGLTTPTCGKAEIAIDGSVISRDSMRDVVGLVSPEVRLYGELSTRENLEFLAGARCGSTVIERVNEVLELVGLAQRADDPVSELSSGLRQRACFAAAILHKPRVLLLDEAFSYLDEAGVAMAHGLIERQAKAGMVVIATNSPEEAALGESRLDLGSPAPDAGAKPSTATFQPPVGQAGLMNLARRAAAVFVKDVRCEFRAKHALGAVLMFAVTSAIAVSFTLQGFGANAAVSSSLLWLVVYFSAMSGLSRAFVREEETGTALTLRLAASPNCVYLGKLAFNWALVTALQIVSVPLLLVFMGRSVGNWGSFVALLLLGGLALSAGATAAAAMVAKAATKGAVFAVICFPLLIPALAAAIHGTTAAMGHGSAAGDIRLLASYSGSIIIASLMLFRYIWEE